MFKKSFIPIFPFCKSEMHTNIRRGTQIRPYHFRPFRPFILRCGISRTSPRSHVELLDRLCEVWSTAVISIHSPVFWCLRAESESNEQRNGEESDNLFSRVSRRCCSYAASFFVYHIRIGETFFLPAGPWDQTGFHRRGAVTEYMAIPEVSKPRDVSRGRTFPRSICQKENLFSFEATFCHALGGGRLIVNWQ